MNPNSHLAHACLLAMTELCEEKSFDDLPEPVFSAVFQKKIRRFISLSRGNRYHRFTRTAKVLLAAAVIALLLLITAAAAKHYGFTLINFGTNGILDMEKKHQKTTPLEYGFIPEGFVLDQEYFNKDSSAAYVVLKNDADQHIVITKHGDYGTNSINTEGRTVYTVTKETIEYIVVTSPSYTDVYWMDPITGVFYEIGSQLDAETLLSIAEDVK